MPARPFHQFKQGDLVVIHSGPHSHRVDEVVDNIVLVRGNGWLHWGSLTLVDDCDWYLENVEDDAATWVGTFPTRQDAEACRNLQSKKWQWRAVSASGQQE